MLIITSNNYANVNPETVQIPQFILEEAIQQGHGSACNIVVTQVIAVSMFIAQTQSLTLAFHLLNLYLFCAVSLLIL